MKKFFLAVLGLVVLVIGAALVLPFVLPTETYKRELAAQVKQATGRELAIDGPLGVSLLPRVTVQVEDLHFASVEGSAHPDLLQLGSLQAELEIWPLLQGTVEVARFVLVEPRIHLEIDADGRPNWMFGDPAAGSTEPAAGTGDEPRGAEDGQAGPGTDSGKSGIEELGLPVTQVKLGDIHLENGSLTFVDRRSGTEERLDAIHLRLDLPDLSSRLQADGKLDYKGRTITLDLAADNPLGLALGGSSPVSAALEAPDLALAFEGLVATAAVPSATGQIDLNVASIREVAAWLATPLAFEGEGLRLLRVSGKLDGSTTQVALNDAELTLDAIEGRGQLVADLSGTVPRLTGRLDLGALDLNPYLPPAAAEEEIERAAAPPPAERQGGEPVGDRVAATEPGEERAHQPSPPPAAADWSDEPIALPPIGGVEVDVELTVASLALHDLRLDRTVLGVEVKEPRLTAVLSEIALYGGSGQGRVDLEVVDGTPRIREQFQLDGLQALPFLTAAAQLDRLEGTASGVLTLETQGRTERELIQNLNGDGRFTFENGALVGINLAAMVRNAASAFQGGGETRKTDFAELRGSFAIRDGILSNDDLWLQAPTLRVAGRGQVNLPGRTVDYRVEPKAAKTLEGQGGEQEVAGLLVPVVVRGPWDDPTFTPDLSDIARRALEDPEALKEEVKEQLDDLDDLADDVKDAIEDGDTEEILKGLMRPDEQGGSPAGRLLKGLLGD